MYYMYPFHTICRLTSLYIDYSVYTQEGINFKGAVGLNLNK